jgi:putative hydrolase of the HAD superfamily
MFDLDDTLYPPSAAMNRGMHERMISFTASFLGIPQEEAERKRGGRHARYGTTLEWLQGEYHIEDIKGYFSWVHPPSEISEIQRDPKLRPFLSSLKLPMTILTNGPLDHAVRVLEFLNVADLFGEIWDIDRNNLRGKPHKSAYRNALHASGFTMEETLFFDDNPSYVEGWEKLGGRGVLVSGREDYRRLLPNTPWVSTV